MTQSFIDLTVAESILCTPDRTPKERRVMAELRAAPAGEWMGRDGIVCRFHDGSALLMALDESLVPTEFLVVNPDSVEVGRADLRHYAEELADLWRHLGRDDMIEQVEAHLESNYPDVDDRIVELIVATLH